MHCARLGPADRIACTQIVSGSDFSSSSFCGIILFLILKHMVEAGGSNLKIFTDTHSHAQTGCSRDFLIFPFSRKEIEKNPAGHSGLCSENARFIEAGDILLLGLLGRRGPKVPIHAQ